MFKKLGRLWFSLVMFAGLFVTVPALVTYSSPVEPQVAGPLPALPAGLKSTFMVGLGNQPGDYGWMTGSGIAWDARYTYLSAGVRTGYDWSTWNYPPGEYARLYMQDSYNAGYLPVLTYYMLLQSNPGIGNSEGEKVYNNLNDTATMNAYYANFKLLMDKAREFGKTVIVHIEPDFWGYMQLRNNNPNNIPAAVASSGYPGLGGLPNTAAGFARALVQLRNTYASNVRLAYHISPWSSSQGWMGSSDPALNVTAIAQDIGNYYLQMQAGFDLLFYDIADRDAALRASWGDTSAWWDVTNTTYPNFNRFNQFFTTVTAVTGKRGVVWQIPVGNTLYRTLNNTQNHYQDNRVQYYLGQDNNQKLSELAAAGIVGLLFGAGDGQTTTPYDSRGDGVTNPAPINGNNLVSSYADDDGGYLRLRGAAYFQRGRQTVVPQAGSNPAPGTSIARTTIINTTASATIAVSNNGGPNTGLTLGAPSVTGSGAAAFTIVPATPLTVIAGSPAQNITVQCKPLLGISYGATLSYATNDPARPVLSYNLNCTGLAPVYSSAPALPGAFIEIATPYGTPGSTTFDIRNSGGAGTSLSVGAPAKSGPDQAIFTVAPAGALNLAAGGAAQTVTVQCTPPQAQTYQATLSYTTGDPARPAVSYNLRCTGLAPVYSSSPAPGSTLKLAQRLTRPVSTTLAINNTGGAGTLLAASDPLLVEPPGQSVFTVSPATGFSGLGVGAAARLYTITCTPPAQATYTATLTLPVSGAPPPDPAFTAAAYNLSCQGLTPLEVTVPDDTGDGQAAGTLSWALANYTPGSIIVFNLSAGNEVRLAAPLIINGGPVAVPVVVDGGDCSGAPTITSAPGNTSGSLTLNGGVTLRNIRIAGLAPAQVTVKADRGANYFGPCVKISKT